MSWLPNLLRRNFGIDTLSSALIFHVRPGLSSVLGHRFAPTLEALGAYWSKGGYSGLVRSMRIEYLITM